MKKTQNKLNTFLNCPYELLINKKLVVICIGIAAILVLFLLAAFKPFDIWHPDHNTQLEISIYVCIGVGVAIIYFYWISKYLITNYTVKTTILSILLCIIIIGIACGIFATLYLMQGVFDFAHFWLISRRVFLIILFPAFFATLIHAIVTTSRLHPLSSIDDKNNKTNIIIKTETKKEKSFTLPLESIIYFESQNNYVEINYVDSVENKKKLVRYTLTKLMSDNNEISELFRCHKSFIVNKSMIIDYTGNTSGYKLILKNSDKMIPVSRKLNHMIEMLK